jgi:hypothetical protein
LGQSSHTLHVFFAGGDAGGGGGGGDADEEGSGSAGGAFVVEFGLLVDTGDAGVLVSTVGVGCFVVDEDPAVVVVGVSDKGHASSRLWFALAGTCWVASASHSVVNTGASPSCTQILAIALWVPPQRRWLGSYWNSTFPSAEPRVRVIGGV